MTRWRPRISVLSVTIALFGVSCAENIDQGSTGHDPASVRSTEQELIDVSRVGVSYPYLEVPLPFPAGIAGGDRVVFIGSPFEGRVAAFSRVLGRPLGDLPPPEQGFILPFILKSTNSNTVSVLDAGGFPSPKPFIPASPIIYEYEYSYDRRHGLAAELTRTISFDSVLVGFAEDAIKLDDGRYLLSDAVLGSIWIAEPDGSIEPGIVPETFESEDAIPEMYFCDSMPLIDVGGVPFLFTGSTVPGITSMAVRNGLLYFAGSCAGAVYSVPLSVLEDGREPWERAHDISIVSQKPAGVQVEQLLGITFDFNHPEHPYLYAADALQLRVIRINVNSGHREVVGDDPTLFNFPSSIGFLPSVTPHGILSTLLVLSNQQHLTPLTNDAIGEDMFEPPFLATKVLIPHFH